MNTEDQILSWCARNTWRDKHPGTECPTTMVPSEAALCAWFLTAPKAAAKAEANALIPAVARLPETAKWVVMLAHSLNTGEGPTIHLPDELVVICEDIGLQMSIEAMHNAWLALPETDRPRHPLAPLIEAWQGRPVPVEPFRPRRRASLPQLHRIGRADEDTHLPGFPRGGPDEPSGQLDLPGFGPVVESCPSWLLWMFDRAGGESMAQGRGAPWPMRLFVGALLHLAVRDRTFDWRTLRIPTEDVIAWLHPDGWANRRRDWEKFPAALDAMAQRLAWVPVPGLGSVAMLFPSVIPRTPDDPLVEFTIRIPAAAAHGARIDWPTLCRYGQDSAALYRAYLSVSTHLDQSAHHGHAITAEIAAPVLGQDGQPVRRKGGAIVRDLTAAPVPNPAAQYVAPLSDKDLARMIGLDPTNKRRRFDARKAFEQLHADGVIDLQRDGRGFRLFGPRTKNAD